MFSILQSSDHTLVLFKLLNLHYVCGLHIANVFNVLFYLGYYMIITQLTGAILQTEFPMG